MLKQLKAYQFRLYPDTLQKQLINKTIGSSRFIYNHLNIQKMLENKQSTKQIMDVSWNELIRQLEYKSKQKSKRFIQVGTYYASSQICNRCGSKNEKVKDLNIRYWECSKCGTRHDRDVNASINIMNEGLKILFS